MQSCDKDAPSADRLPDGEKWRAEPGLGWSPQTGTKLKGKDFLGEEGKLKSHPAARFLLGISILLAAMQLFFSTREKETRKPAV